MGKFEITIPRGSTYKLTVELYYTTGVRFADPLATVKAYAKQDLNQQQYDIELFGHYTNGSDGAVWVFTFTPNDTINLSTGYYFFEIRVDGTNDDESYSYVALSIKENDFYIDDSVINQTTP